MTGDFDVVLDWIRQTDAEPVAAKIVAGASREERRRLAALGGVVGGLVPRKSLENWPVDVLEWVNAGPIPPESICAAASRALGQEPDSALAALYAQLVSRVSRRFLGTFFTPAPEVNLMIDMWGDAEPPPSTVVDVGAGVGVFTIACASRWPSADVHAVDINPVTLGLLGLRVHLGNVILRADSSDKPGVRLVRDDYASWVPTLNSTDTPRLTIGNPPYTRSQLLTRGERARLHELAGDLCGSRASLSALITAITLRRLGPEDGLSFLLPAQWLEADYAAPLRNYLAGLSGRRIELRLVESRLFADAKVDAVVLQVGRQHTRSQQFQISTWTNSARDHGKRIVARDELVNARWRTIFDAPSQPGSHNGTNAVPNGGSHLSEYCALRRGTATGANKFFILTDEEVHQHNLDDAVVKLVRRLINYPEIITERVHDEIPKYDKRWLLNVTAEDREQGGAIDLYLNLGEARGVHERYLCADRGGAWYDLNHDLVVPDVIVGPMTRDAIRFVENRASAAITNNLYGWTWHTHVSSQVRTAVLNWLRDSDGQATLIAAARSRGAGLMKIEPRALAAIVIPRSIACPPPA